MTSDHQCSPCFLNKLAGAELIGRTQVKADESEAVEGAGAGLAARLRGGGGTGKPRPAPLVVPVAAAAAAAEDDCALHRREEALRVESDALFRQLDRNGDGTLSRKEVKKGLHILEQGTGLKLAGKRAKEAFSYLDDTHDGEVDADEFFAFMSTAQERKASNQLFRQLDRNGDGLLTRREIKKGLAALEEQSGIIMKAKAVMDEADLTGGGKLDRNEFFKFVLAHKMHEAGAASFRSGDVVVWLKADEDIPEGSKGIVLGFNANGRVRLRFKQLNKEFSFKPAELVKLRATGDGAEDIDAPEDAAAAPSPTRSSAGTVYSFDGVETETNFDELWAVIDGDDDDELTRPQVKALMARWHETGVFEDKDGHASSKHAVNQMVAHIVGADRDTSRVQKEDWIMWFDGLRPEWKRRLTRRLRLDGRWNDVDLDGDGRLELWQAKALLRQVGWFDTAERAKEINSDTKSDINSDSAEAEEWHFQRWWTTYDANQSGEISRLEFARWWVRHGLGVDGMSLERLVAIDWAEATRERQEALLIQVIPAPCLTSPRIITAPHRSAARRVSPPYASSHLRRTAPRRRRRRRSRRSSSRCGAKTTDVPCADGGGPPPPPYALALPLPRPRCRRRPQAHGPRARESGGGARWQRGGRERRRTDARGRLRRKGKPARHIAAALRHRRRNAAAVPPHALPPPAEDAQQGEGGAAGVRAEQDHAEREPRRPRRADDGVGG
jgi:Ca2+-binding EF-hand superfamily protein